MIVDRHFVLRGLVWGHSAHNIRNDGIVGEAWCCWPGRGQVRVVPQVGVAAEQATAMTDQVADAKHDGSVDISEEDASDLEQRRNALRDNVEDMPDKMDDSEIPAVVNDRFEVGDKIGSGSYGSVFMATDQVTGEKVALKIESNKALKQKRKQLLHELLLYKQLQGGVGIPKIAWFGSDKALHGRQCLALELLGPSLSDLFKRGKNRGFALNTVAILAPQLIDRIEFCHSKGLIHRDIKPNNFVMGFGRHARQCYLIDFGLSTRYWKTGTRVHMDYEDGKRLTGTARYASVNNHVGIHHSRRDDLECLGFVLVYLVKGKLPWQGIRAKTKARKFAKIKRKKMETPISVLCAGLPPEFQAYMNYVRGLKFAEEPDYAYLRSLFWSALERRGIDRSYEFEWETNPDMYGYTAVPNIPKSKSKKQSRSAKEAQALANAAQRAVSGGGGGRDQTPRARRFRDSESSGRKSWSASRRSPGFSDSAFATDGRGSTHEAF